MLKRVLPMMVITIILMSPTVYAGTEYTTMADVEATGLNIELLEELCQDNIEMQATFLAIIEHESYFNPNEIHLNKDGTHDYGLGQFNDTTFEFLRDEIGISSMQDLLDGDTNLRAIKTLIDYHLDATGSLDDAILRYQVGNGSYARLHRRGVTTTKTHQNVLLLQEKYITLLNEA